MEERNMMNPHNPTAANRSNLFCFLSSDGLSKVLGGGQITNEEAESFDKKHKLKELTCGDISSENVKDDSNHKKGLHYHQDQRRMSLTSIVEVQPPSSSDAV